MWMTKLKNFILNLLSKKCDFCHKPLPLEINNGVCNDAKCKRLDALRRYLDTVFQEKQYTTNKHLL